MVLTMEQMTKQSYPNYRRITRLVCEIEAKRLGHKLTKNQRTLVRHSVFQALGISTFALKP